jgi:hypothetical protein
LAVDAEKFSALHNCSPKSSTAIRTEEIFGREERSVKSPCGMEGIAAAVKTAILYRLEMVTGLIFGVIAGNSNRGVPIGKAVTSDERLVASATWRKRKARYEIGKNL